ncbi:hypothetical protein D3C80_1168740 [compost metagenome]
MDAIADIAKAPNIAALQSAFNAAKTIAYGFDDLIAQVVNAKDKRKHELTPQEQST